MRSMIAYCFIEGMSSAPRISARYFDSTAANFPSERLGSLDKRPTDAAPSAVLLHYESSDAP